jgi:hypothetical protein
MNLEQIVKETVAKMVDEKHLTAAETKKKEDIVMAMKKDFKGPKAAMYAIATDKAKKLAESDPQTIAKISNAIEAGKIDPKEVEAAAIKASQGNSDDLAILMVNAMSGMGRFQENELNEDYEVAMAQDSLDSIIRAAMELKTRLGDDEKDIPAWIQDHITNSESYIYQAAKSYHEYNAEEGTEEMNEEYNSEQSAIESASGDKITGTEEDDYGTTLYIGQDKYDQYFIVNGEIKHDNFQKGIKGHTIGDLKHYGDGQNHSSDDTMHESQDKWVKKDSFDDYVNGDSATYNGEPVTIEQLYLNTNGGARAAKIKLADGSIDTIYINDLDENIMTTNEGRSAEELKLIQLNMANDHLEKLKNSKYYGTKDNVESIKKTEERIEKLGDELEALAAKETNESLDEATVRRWQHYAGIK